MIGIQLDIQNYPNDIFWGSMVPMGKASPPSGAVASKYDIGEGADGFGYDPDDSTLLSCDQFPFIALYGLSGSLAMVHKGTHNYQISPFFDEFNVMQARLECS